jgi:ribosomal protein L37AE/L43A
MNRQNRYCTRCGRTTPFSVEGGVFTCTGCGVRIEPARKLEDEKRSLIGDPFHNFRIRFV